MLFNGMKYLYPFFLQVNEDQVPPLSETDMCETATLCGEA